jgi:DNA-3-methyladenine glycosylase
MLGPAKLTQALGIGRAENGVDLCSPAHGLWIEAGVAIPDALVTTAPRVGLNRVAEPWKSIPWRFIARWDGK